MEGYVDNGFVGFITLITSLPLNPITPEFHHQQI